MGQTREAHRGCSRKSAQGKQGEHGESNQGMLANHLSTSIWLYHQDLPSKDRKIASMKEKELLQEKERIIEENKVIWLFIAALIYNFIHSSQAVIAESLRRWSANHRGEALSFVDLLRTLPMVVPADLLEIIYQGESSRALFDSLLTLTPAAPPVEVRTYIITVASHSNPLLR